jgi:hypothetical protein
MYAYIPGVLLSVHSIFLIELQALTERQDENCSLTGVTKETPSLVIQPWFFRLDDRTRQPSVSLSGEPWEAGLQ